MLLPVVHILLNEGLVQTDHTLEKADRLLAIIYLCCCELVNRCIVSLELASLEERYRVLGKRQGGQLR